MPDLHALCALFDYKLVYDPAPFGRVDALGLRGPGVFAQLCAGRVIAASSLDWDAVYSISHEVAHGLLWDQPNWTEQDVFCEQARVLSRWVRELMEAENSGNLVPGADPRPFPSYQPRGSHSTRGE